MEVREVIARAKGHVAEAFFDEKLSNLGLEEVRFDDDEDAWLITLGFSREWIEPKMMTTALGRDLDLNRTYKLVKISDLDGKLLSVTDRMLGPVES